MSTNPGKISMWVLGLAAAICLDPAGAAWADEPPTPGADLPWADARVLAEVLERVEREYVNPVDDHQLLQAAIRGMVSSLDPYSAYLDGEEYDEVKISSSGRYSGVGIEVSMEDEQVVVVSPLEGSSAAAAGIRTGDIITTIDGVAVNTDTLSDTIGRMRGKEGTSVTIGILREGSSEPLQFTLKRTAQRKVGVARGRFRVRENFPIQRNHRRRFGGCAAGSSQAQWCAAQGADSRPAQQSRRRPGSRGVRCRPHFWRAAVIVTAKGRTPESKFEMDATPGMP